LFDVVMHPALALHRSHPSVSRRARRASDELFEAGSVASWSELGASGAHGSTNAAAPDALRAAWDQLGRELDRASRPQGRATPAIRGIVRRIVHQMMTVGASRDEIRDALTRAVSSRHRGNGSTADKARRFVSDALLADVLQCAAWGGMAHQQFAARRL
jgi:hypothetical protein